MKHAFLIIAYNNWNQLCKLVQQIDASNHDIYIHIDSKVKNVPFDKIKGIAKKSKVSIYSETAVNWGGYSLVKAELLLLKKSHSAYMYDYYHIISGQDLMTVNCEVFDTFFEKNRGLEFIEFKDDYLNNPECVRRTKYYHFLQEYRRHFKKQILNSFFTFLERISLVFQIIIHVDRTKSLDWSIRVGSEWVSITDGLVSDILNNEEKIKKIFSNTNCSDELFIPTVAFNCGYNNRIYKWNGKTTNMRWIDFSRGGNGNPYTIHKEDINTIAKSHNLFARKFSEAVDEEAIDKMIEQAKYAKNISD